MPPLPEITDAAEPNAAAAGRLIALLHSLDGCSQSLRRALDALAIRFELNATQLTVLWASGDSNEGIGQSQLATRIGFSPAQASALVEQLRQRNLLEARRAVGDRRRQQWSLTALGHEIVRAAAIELAEIETRVNADCDQPTQELSDRVKSLSATIEQTRSQIAGAAFPRLYGVPVHAAERDAGPGQRDCSPCSKNEEVRR
jgi:DNA-binding MarR family transcriptional regulator